MISAELLRRIRNDLPMPVTIAALGREGPPSKIIEGYFRFVCPRCGELRATVNPRNNLAHCFCCKNNLNNIDLLLTIGYDFLASRSSNAGSSSTRPSRPNRNRRPRRTPETTCPLSQGRPMPPRNAHDLPSTVALLLSRTSRNSGIWSPGGQNPYGLNLARNAIRIRTGTVARIKSVVVTSLKNGLRFIHYGMEVVQAKLQGQPLPLPLAESN